MPKFKEPEVEVKFISNCFEVSYFWSIEEAGKQRLCRIPTCEHASKKHNPTSLTSGYQHSQAAGRA